MKHRERQPNSTHTVRIAGYETVAFFEGQSAATEYAKWAYRVGYSPMTERMER